MTSKCSKRLIDQMDRLKKQPPPTLEQVERQMAGSIRQIKASREQRRPE